MKVLIANWVYNWGSTGYIVRDLKDELTHMGHHVQVATGRNNDADDAMVFGRPSEQKWFWRLHRIGVSPLRGSTNAAKRLIRYIEKETPDVVNLHLLHCNFINLYYLLQWLRIHNIKTVITNHAELYYTGGCGHAYDCEQWKTNECRCCSDKKNATGAYVFGRPHRLWKKIMHSFQYFKPENLIFTAVSPWLQGRFLQSPISRDFECMVAMNGLNTKVFYRHNNSCNIVERMEAMHKSFVLWVTAYFNPIDKADVKGGHYIVELARMMPEQHFVIVATNMNNAENLPTNIFLWGKAKDQNELAQIYSAAELTVLVSRRETFSMVTAESLCCGTPVVGFKAGGPESIALKDYSKFVEQGDVTALADAVRIMKHTNFDRVKLSSLACQTYSSQAMANQYINVYNKLIN